MRLASRYDRLREADARGDEVACARAFEAVAGLADGPAPRA
ncbi:MAG: hypothetical protein JWM10_3478, partial [Myxococcaceae bacterium]|nr:hypothetical protein [Myxococcaceae bacterium]